MTDDTDKLSCPRCGHQITKPQDVPSAVREDEQVRDQVTCPGCETMLEVVTEANSSGSGLDVWIEDHRDGEN